MFGGVEIVNNLYDIFIDLFVKFGFVGFGVFVVMFVVWFVCVVCVL